MQYDGDSYSYSPKHFDVNGQAEQSYEQYTVKTSNQQYLVCNSTQGTQNQFIIQTSGERPQDWANLNYQGFDFSDVWTPTNQIKIGYAQTMVTDKLGDGYKSKNPYGLNQDIIQWSISFENIQDLEAKQLMIFAEVKGGVGIYKHTLPQPYNQQKYFRIASASVQYNGYDQNQINFIVNEVYQQNNNI